MLRPNEVIYKLDLPKRCGHHGDIFYGIKDLLVNLWDIMFLKNELTFLSHYVLGFFYEFVVKLFCPFTCIMLHFIRVCKGDYGTKWLTEQLKLFYLKFDIYDTSLIADMQIFIKKQQMICFFCLRS